MGAAVARAFAREGAAVHLAGRTVPPLDDVARRIRGDGGVAHVAQLDAVDREAADRHADAAAAGNGIDICFNATANDDVQGSPLADMAVADVIRPVTKAVTTTITTATAAARHMIAHRVVRPHRRLPATRGGTRSARHPRRLAALTVVLPRPAGRTVPMRGRS
ncbi:SDR family NAD(P)-dependent oxidoreductase [Streptomyces sp. NPDC051218]|uniref:SDR family NAD(P)-dependent oxidoreductase n=1 Tax=Streptomyces sp. NPDC051218 TaxID=3365645 RepID=UPI00378D0C83